MGETNKRKQNKVAPCDKKSNPAIELLSPTNPISSANNVNRFFISIGSNLTESSLTNNLPSISNLQFQPFLSTTSELVSSFILNLKKVTTTGQDIMSGVFLKRYHHILVPP